jgi:hypothetical protein
VKRISATAVHLAGTMEIRAIIDGRCVLIEPASRGALLYSDPDGLRRLQEEPRTRVRATLVLSVVFAVIALIYTNAWFFIAMGLMLSIAWLSQKRGRELQELGDFGPGVYEGGVQLASDTFIPFSEIARASRTSPSTFSSGPGLVLTSSAREMEWAVPASIVGLEGLAAIEDIVGGQPAGGLVQGQEPAPRHVAPEARLGSESS